MKNCTCHRQQNNSSAGICSSPRTLIFAPWELIFPIGDCLETVQSPVPSAANYLKIKTLYFNLALPNLFHRKFCFQSSLMYMKLCSVCMISSSAGEIYKPKRIKIHRAYAIWSSLLYLGVTRTVPQ
jgi:hypothetical protein